MVSVFRSECNQKFLIKTEALGSHNNQYLQRSIKAHEMTKQEKKGYSEYFYIFVFHSIDMQTMWFSYEIANSVSIDRFKNLR